MPKTKAVNTKATKRRSRVEVIASAEFKQAFAAARKKSPERKRCKTGHDLTNAKNVDTGCLLRTGRISCYPCWCAINDAYVARKAKEAKAAAKK